MWLLLYPGWRYGSLWCTNHYPNHRRSETLPTYGVLNQIAVGLGQQPAYGQAVWNSAMNSFPAGMDKTTAIDSFRHQFGLSPLFSHPPGTVFYPSNTFNAPFQPVRSIYLLTSWQANDPLVHYTVGDLTSLTRTNLVLDNLPVPAPLANLGHVNLRYEPWGGNPAAGGYTATTFDLTGQRPFGAPVRLLGLPHQPLVQSERAGASPPRHTLADALPEIVRAPTSATGRRGQATRSL